jgi:threonine synthase
LRYLSTRGEPAALAFDDVLLAGLARDGGLYVPETWPQFSAAEWRALRGKRYHEIAFAVLKPYVGGAIPDADLARLTREAYANFTHQAVAPLKQLDANLWALELFHGPTLAFKDYALQLVGKLFDYVLAKKGQRITIVGATSGDTGPAGIAAVAGSQHIDIVVLHPNGRTSPVQRRQMTTVLDPNVHNVALEGTFDDCQDLVKALFGDLEFRDRYRLSAINSINWARIAGQIVYYVHAALALGAPDRAVSFCVPTGNFGNVLAADAARRMGLPIERLVVATNRNDIVARTILTGTMALESVAPTITPSMDIQVSSNFERLVFELAGRDGRATAAMMTEFRQSGKLAFPQGMKGALADGFDAGAASEAETLNTIAKMRLTTGEIVDPHTAVAIHVAQRAKSDAPIVVASTAHPAKFPDAVEKATGIRPALPDFLADLFERKERVDILPNDAATLKKYVAAHAKAQ